VKIGAEYGWAAEKPGFGLEKGLRIRERAETIAKTFSKSQFNAVNNPSNGKSRMTQRK
jgi:hypothetical protein